MYYDLNVPYTVDGVELKRTLTFLAELGYGTIALTYTISGPLPANIENQIPEQLPFELPATLKILRRCTLQYSDPGQNYRLSKLSAIYDVLALRPTTEKTFQQACHSLECDVVSIDLSIRYPFFFQIKTVKSALDRGVRFEICYAPGISNADGGNSRRNLISNATQLIRATRGRGIIISSEAKSALACRGPADIVNLAGLWGLRRELGSEAIGRQARTVVSQAELKRRSFRGVIDIVYGGEPSAIVPSSKSKSIKRKADFLGDEASVLDPTTKPLSKREQKRRAKTTKQEAGEQNDVSTMNASHEAGKQSAMTTRNG